MSSLLFSSYVVDAEEPAFCWWTCSYQSPFPSLPICMHIRKPEPWEEIKENTEEIKERIIVQLLNSTRIFHSQFFLFLVLQYILLQYRARCTGVEMEGKKRHLFCRLRGFVFFFFVVLARPDFDNFFFSCICCVFMQSFYFVQSWNRNCFDS